MVTWSIHQPCHRGLFLSRRSSAAPPNCACSARRELASQFWSGRGVGPIWPQKSRSNRDGSAWILGLMDYSGWNSWLLMILDDFWMVFDDYWWFLGFGDGWSLKIQQPETHENLSLKPRTGSLWDTWWHSELPRVAINTHTLGYSPFILWFYVTYIDISWCIEYGSSMVYLVDAERGPLATPVRAPLARYDSQGGPEDLPIWGWGNMRYWYWYVRK